jgi:hypothetical protein
MYFSKAHSLIALAGSVFALCSLMVGLRFYVQFAVLKFFIVDGWSILYAVKGSRVDKQVRLLIQLKALALATFIC